MKYIVELKYTNPGHEHVSLRRRVDTVTRMVEASNEQEAINRAANQQRSLGFMIKEAKVLVAKTPAPVPTVIAESKKEDAKDKKDMEEKDKEEMDEGIAADMMADRREKAQKAVAKKILDKDMADEKKKRQDKRQAGTGKVVAQKTDADVTVNVAEETVSERVVNKKVAPDVPTPGQKKKVKAAKIAIGAARSKINLKPVV